MLVIKSLSQSPHRLILIREKLTCHLLRLNVFHKKRRKICTAKNNKYCTNKCDTSHVKMRSSEKIHQISFLFPFYVLCKRDRWTYLTVALASHVLAKNMALK